MSKKINRKKALLCWLIWTVIYFYGIQYMIYKYSGFHLFSASELHAKYHGFIQGQWSMNASEALVFFVAVLLFFPIWFLGTKILYNRSRNISSVFKRRPKIHKKPITISATGHKLSMPMKLRAQPGAKPSVSPASATTPPTTTPQQQNDEQLPAGLIDMLTKIATQKHLDLFQNLSIGGTLIPVALSSEEHAYIITIIQSTSGIVTDTTDIIDGMWFTSSAQLPSPARAVLNATEQIHQAEQDSHVTPIILIAAGSLDESETIQSALSEHNITLLRYGTGGPDSLMELETFLQQIPDTSDKTDTPDEINEG